MKYKRWKTKDEIYRSGLELAIANLLTKEGIKFTYETMRLSYWKKVHRGLCRDCESHNVYSKHDYTPDFHIPSTDTIIEVKGMFSSKDRGKHAALREQYPDLKLVMWFAGDRRIATKKEPDRTYTKWCDKHDIPYHVGIKKLPKEWL